MSYELLVIGNGRESIDGALSTARRGASVALARMNHAPEHDFSIDVLRRAVSGLGGVGSISIKALRRVATEIASEQWRADHSELERLGVDVYCGDMRFIDARTIEVIDTFELLEPRLWSLQASRILLACGTRSVRPSHVPFDSRRILDVELLLMRDELPSSMIVVGAGETGLDYAMLLASLGVDVTVIDAKANVFDVYGGMMNEARLCELQSLDIAFRMGDEMIGIESRGADSVAVRLSSGKVFVAEAALVCVGRVGETESLNLEVTGVGLDERGRIWCNANGGTWASHITAVGNIIGFRAANALAG